MPRAALLKHLTLSQSDLNAFFALSLKAYRLLTCRNLSLLYYPSEDVCHERMSQLCQAGLVTRLFIPSIDGEKRDEIYTLSRAGAQALATHTKSSPLGLASYRKPSFLFLEHALRISDFMCAMEAALKESKTRLLSWRSERQLKPARGRGLTVLHPFELGEKIPVIPDGHFALETDGRVEHFFLEADRGTMSLFVMKKKMLGYIQLYRKGLHSSYYGVTSFRVLIVTTTAYRRDKMREALRKIIYCPNLFWFVTWRDISTERILGNVWLKCNDQVSHSILE